MRRLWIGRFLCVSAWACCFCAFCCCCGLMAVMVGLCAGLRSPVFGLQSSVSMPWQEITSGECGPGPVGGKTRSSSHNGRYRATDRYARVALAREYGLASETNELSIQFLKRFMFGGRGGTAHICPKVHCHEWQCADGAEAQAQAGAGKPSLGLAYQGRSWVSSPHQQAELSNAAPLTCHNLTTCGATHSTRTRVCVCL